MLRGSIRVFKHFSHKRIMRIIGAIGRSLGVYMRIICGYATFLNAFMQPLQIPHIRGNSNKKFVYCFVCINVESNKISRINKNDLVNLVNLRLL